MTCGQIFISESYQEQVDVHLRVLEPVSPQRMEAWGNLKGFLLELEPVISLE